MDVLNIDRGKLVSFKLSEDEKSVTMVSMVKVRREANALEYLGERLIKGYVNFLKQYFSVYLKPLTLEAEDFIFSSLFKILKNKTKTHPKALNGYPKSNGCIPRQRLRTQLIDDSYSEEYLTQKPKRKKSESEIKKEKDKDIAFLQAQFYNQESKIRLRTIPSNIKNLYLKRNNTTDQRRECKQISTEKVIINHPSEEQEFTIRYDIDQLNRFLSRNVSIRFN